MQWKQTAKKLIFRFESCKKNKNILNNIWLGFLFNYIDDKMCPLNEQCAATEGESICSKAKLYKLYNNTNFPFVWILTSCSKDDITKNNILHIAPYIFTYYRAVRQFPFIQTYIFFKLIVVTLWTKYQCVQNTCICL